MEFLSGLDQQLLLFLNSLHTDALDPVVFAATGTTFWMPFYFWFIYLLFTRLDQRAWFALGAIALTVLAADQLTSTILKPWIERLRPSHDPELSSLLHLLTNADGNVYRGGKFGFPSSHATNSFGVATLIFLLLRRHTRWVWIAFTVAIIISYTRLYAGVHYPSDVLAGALIGSALGYGGWRIYRFATDRWMPEQS